MYTHTHFLRVNYWADLQLKKVIDPLTSTICTSILEAEYILNKYYNIIDLNYALVKCKDN